MQLLSLKIASTPVMKAIWQRIGNPAPKDPCPDCMRIQADTLAFLQCEDGNSGSLVTLPVCQTQEDASGSSRGLFVGTHNACARHRDSLYFSRFRTVHLTKLALTKILEHVTPARIEICILRHHPEPPSAKTFLASITLVPSWPADDGEAVRIPPRDIEALRILGFVVESPLQMLRSETEITVRAALAFNGGENAPFQPTQECPQTIELTLALVRRTSRTWLNDRFRNTAQFSIVNSIGVLASDETVSTSPLATPRGVNSPSYVMRRAPCVHGSGDHSPVVIFSSYIHRRIIANAQFTVYSDADWEADTCTVRTLRISLEYPTKGVFTSKSNADHLWLSVQVSEKYRLRTRFAADMTPPGDFSPSHSGYISEWHSTPSQPPSGDQSKEAKELAVSSSASRATAVTKYAAHRLGHGGDPHAQNQLPSTLPCPPANAESVVSGPSKRKAALDMPTISSPEAGSSAGASPSRPVKRFKHLTLKGPSGSSHVSMHSARPGPFSKRVMKDEAIDTSEPTTDDISVVESEQLEDSVQSYVSSQAALFEKPPTSQVGGGLRRRTPLYECDPEHDMHDDGTTESPGIATPCDVRSRTSSGRPATEPGACQPSYSTFPPPLLSTQPEDVPEFVLGDLDTTHEGHERSGACHRSENDALRAQVATMNAQITELMSKNAEMSLQMAAILARLDASSA